jgi:hypothetical protein
MLSNTNLMLITVSIYNDKTSDKRISNLKKRITKDNLPLFIFYNNKTKYNKWNKAGCIFIKNLYKSIFKFSESNFDYAIICENDFYPADNFLNKLNETVDLLPKNWETLHLCPGWFWGREHFNNKKIEKENIDIPYPEGTLNKFNFDKSKKFIYDLDSKYLVDNHIWLGGPIAILINKKNNNHLKFLKRCMGQFNIKNDPGDVILSKSVTKNDFICFNPQLGKEEECGGTTQYN